jgi:hypothetical protein
MMTPLTGRSMLPSGVAVGYLKKMEIHIPNLRIMLHYFHSLEHLFVTVTMYSGARREHAIEEMARTGAWFGGRFSADHRSDYMERRLIVESLMRKEFAKKYTTPRNTSPVFFYIRPDLSISVIQDGLRKREDLGEHATRYLLIDLNDIHDKSQISFSVRDSHQSYHRALSDAGLDSRNTGQTSPDDGHIFHIGEIADVYARHSDDQDIYFEVQVWDWQILTQWREEHGPL